MEDGGGGDAGVLQQDAGAGGGAGGEDGGTTDAAAPDAGDADAGTTDGGDSEDAGLTDAGLSDAGLSDAGLSDAGLSDAGTTDAGTNDAGLADAGADAGVPDAGPTDARTCVDFGCTTGACCAAVCVDTMSSNEHCGGCNQPCLPPGANMVAACSTGTCQATCNPGFFDCDGVALNGCEAMTACACAPGSSTVCYSAALSTLNVGSCRAGTKTCLGSGLGYGPCLGEIVPVAEVCADGLDNDCNGASDDSLDVDGDGYTKCDGDCCDDLSCPNAASINPGAFEVAGNQVDDDCDLLTDRAPQVCDTSLASASPLGSDAAKALGLCRIIGSQQRTWGVLNASYRMTAGSAAPAAAGHRIWTQFGSNQPQEGSALLALSTGKAVPASSTDYDSLQNTNFSLNASLPPDWLAAVGGVVPRPAGCPAVLNGAAFDPMMLELRLRVPTNARSFSLRANYFSSDYPEYVCSPYVDQFVVLLDSSYQPQGSDPANPSHKNLAVATTDGITPVSTRFLQCVNGVTGCTSGAVFSNYNACIGIDDLVGTGFDTLQNGQCQTGARRGGATGWINLAGNVVPGETITLRIAVWDSGDGSLDSTVLLDRFEWSTAVVTPGG